MLAMAGPFIYRSGVSFTDRNGHRCVFSQTYASEDPIDGFEATVSSYFASQIRATLADPLDSTIQFWPLFGTRIWPTKGLLGGTVISRQNAVTPLNIHAPEAAARLQRVGASGALGRTCYPIVDDSLFTDLPHRRRVNVPLLQKRLDDVIATWNQPEVLFGRRFYRCIWHKKSATWEPVVGWRVLPNTIRIWQRWKQFPLPKHVGNQQIYRPDEGW